MKYDYFSGYSLNYNLRIIPFWNIASSFIVITKIFSKLVNKNNLLIKKIEFCDGIDDTPVPTI